MVDKLDVIESLQFCKFSIIWEQQHANLEPDANIIIQGIRQDQQGKCSWMVLVFLCDRFVYLFSLPFYVLPSLVRRFSIQFCNVTDLWIFNCPGVPWEWCVKLQWLISLCPSSVKAQRKEDKYMCFFASVFLIAYVWLFRHFSRYLEWLVLCKTDLEALNVLVFMVNSLKPGCGRVCILHAHGRLQIWCDMQIPPPPSSNICFSTLYNNSDITSPSTLSTRSSFRANGKGTLSSPSCVGSFFFICESSFTSGPCINARVKHISCISSKQSLT